MKRFLKMAVISFAIIGFLFSSFCVVVAGIYFKHAFLFKAQVIGDVYLVQQPFQEVYDLISKKHGIRIEDAGGVRGWMIADGYLYGSGNSSPEYYVINLESYDLLFFDNLDKLNNYLNELVLPELHMSKQENEVHLKYGRGRDRIYPQEL